MKARLLLLPVLVWALAWTLAGPVTQTFGQEERFPPPEFSEGHTLPETTTPPPDSALVEYGDVLVLLLTLGVAAFVVFRLRSRRAVVWTSLFSLVYFGFWREGCICPIGSIQNVALALFDSGYGIPLTALLFFFLPLVAALFFGRVFCAAVCPQGAIQDLILVRSLPVPAWLDHSLGLFPYVYLGLGVLFAATGSAFVICEYDPFVGFFRRAAQLDMFVLGGCFLAVSLFVGRPYCRYLCPYGALLGLLSRVSRFHLRITPKPCIDCRLCEDSCPMGAIELPTERRVEGPEPAAPGAASRKGRRLALLLLVPVLALGCGFLASRLTASFSREHATVRLAERLQLEDQGKVEGVTDASQEFRERGESRQELDAEATAIRGRFAVGTWALGIFVGLVLGFKIVSLSRRRHRTEYETSRSACQACARCFDYCPENDPQAAWEGAQPLPEAQP